MTLQDLEDRITGACVEYYREHRELPLRQVLQTCLLQVCTLCVMLCEGISALTARRLHDSRTAFVERFRNKGEYSTTEQYALAKRHGVKYYARQKNHSRLCDDEFFSTYRTKKELIENTPEPMVVNSKLKG